MHFRQSTTAIRISRFVHSFITDHRRFVPSVAAVGIRSFFNNRTPKSQSGITENGISPPAPPFHLLQTPMNRVAENDIALTCFPPGKRLQDVRQERGNRTFGLTWLGRSIGEELEGPTRKSRER